jgi:hypothetical protein
VKPTYKYEIKRDKFEEQIKGVTDVTAMSDFCLNHTVCKTRIFIRLRKKKMQVIRQLLATPVNKDFLAGIVLNFGGKEFADLYDNAYKLKHSKKFKKLK